MKSILVFSITFFSLLSYSQSINFNQGKAAVKKYHAIIPFETKRDIPIIQVKIKGRNYNFMLDTGGMTAISQEVAEVLIPNSLAEIAIRDSGDLESEMRVVTIDSVHVGGVCFTGTPAVIMPPSDFMKCLGVDGNIGSNLLRNSVLQFSFRDKTITLTNQIKKLQADKKQSVKMELTDVQSNPYISVSHTNGKNSASEVLLIDTGMTGMYSVALTVYEGRLKPQEVFQELYSATGSYTLGIHGRAKEEGQYKVRILQMDIAGSMISNVTANSTVGSNSRIGAEILKYGKVTLDYHNGRFYFEPYKDKGLDLSEKSWPVEPAIQDGKMVIGIVWDHSYGDRIKTGDIILKMGNTNYENIDICGLAADRPPILEDILILVLKDAVTGDVKEVEITRR